ncbi:hypothetical protein C8R47DRAFT_999072 [Mycena vitilis]|nr:hypothetical protein C8R47DRAFT_999072 [Mycena vitilis]
MHDCLKITELVDMICSHLRRSGGAPDQHALATLARTCTTFKDPALDYLWKSTTLGQLLTSCMPPDLWAIDIVEPKLNRTQSPLRPICSSDWQRVHLYARRIRKLSSGRDRWFLDAIFPALSLTFPESLLDNLQHLQWYHHGDDFHYISMFLRPSLISITINLTSAENSSLFSRLGQRCPKLANISIGALDSLDLRPMSQFVACLAFAQTISVPWLEHDALEHLSTLPMLKSLQMGRLPKARLALAGHEVDVFPALRDFCVIEQGALEDVTSLLQLCSKVPLEILSVDLDHHPLPADVQAFLAAVEGTRAAPLGWYSPHAPPPVAPSLTPPMAHVLPLSFKNLTSLHLNCALGFDLDDHTVSLMAQAWPQIEQLFLNIVTFNSRPRTTLESLHSIAQYCARITTLTIAFDGSADQTPSAHSPGIIVGNESLRQMNVLHSPITTAKAMAEFLARVFPNLYRIATSRDFMDNWGDAELQEHWEAIQYHRCWKEVSVIRAMAAP